MTADTTIIGTFKDETIAEKAARALHEEGFPEGDVQILQGGIDAIVAELVERGFGKDDARRVAEAAEQGKTLLAALVSADKADHASQILDRLEAAEDEDAPAEDAPAETVEIVEEDLDVSKEKIATGGVRVTSGVEEVPVEESVTLREERVSVEERPADRALSDEEAEAAFEEKTVEVLGTVEVADVSKEARVVGEIAIEKAVEQKEKTVRGTLRKTDVEVEDLGTKPRGRK